jgi:hypothetical protein
MSVIRYLRVFTNRAPGSHSIVVPVEVLAESSVAGHPLATIRPVGGAGECRVRQCNLSDSLPDVGSDETTPKMKKVRK